MHGRWMQVLESSEQGRHRHADDRICGIGRLYVMCCGGVCVGEGVTGYSRS